MKMIVEPKIKGFICITAHPKGCAKNIADSVAYLEKNPRLDMPKIKNALVIGSSTGYGLASAMAASFSLGANVIGVAFEKNAQAERGRTATAGLYNLAAYQNEADRRNLYLKTIIGDAFSRETKGMVCEIVKSDERLKQIDMIIYSVAAPARIDPETGERHSSVLKPIGKAYTSKGIDLASYRLNETTIQPASDEEVKSTVRVMGGEDLELWVDTLSQNGLLAENAAVISYSYIGPPVTHGIYLNGSVGAAKNHLKSTSDKLNKSHKVKSYVSVLGAVVTQSSAAIPVLPLYISILFKVMKEKNLHETCIAHIYRLFEKLQKLQSGENLADGSGFIRMDELEMRRDVQEEVARRWDEAADGNLDKLADIDGYRKDFLNLFGFGLDGVDYAEDVEIEVDEDSLGIINAIL